MPFTLDLFLLYILQHILDFSTSIPFHCVFEQPQGLHLGTLALWGQQMRCGGRLCALEGI